MRKVQNQLSIICMTKTECPFELGEIAVFESAMRFEKFISRIREIHIEYWGFGGMPQITKATDEQKRLWYENGEFELILEKII